MADAKPASETPAGVPKKSSMLVMGLVGLNVALMAAAGAYFFLTSGAQAESEGEDASEGADGEEGDEEGDEEEEGEEEGEESEHEVGPMVEFESMVVNLQGATPDHYLKVTFQLEVRSEEELEHVEPRMVIFRDQVLAYLVTLSVVDVVGAERGQALREELLGIARHVFGRHTIRGIYFTELLVQ